MGKISKSHSSSMGGLSFCSHCALSLVNNHSYFRGIGNPNTGRCLILPSYDVRSYQIISETLGITDISEIAYVTQLIKCLPNPKYPPNITCKRICYNYIIQEFRSYIGFTDVLVLGDAARFIFGFDNLSNYLNKLIINQVNIKFAVNYDPLIKFKDTIKFEVFKEYLLKWYLATETKTYNYEIIRMKQ